MAKITGLVKTQEIPMITRVQRTLLDTQSDAGRTTKARLRSSIYLPKPVTDEQPNRARNLRSIVKNKNMDITLGKLTEEPQNRHEIRRDPAPVQEDFLGEPTLDLREIKQTT